MKRTNLIGISGKIGSGKDTVGIIIQGLNMSLDNDMIIEQIRLNKPFDPSCGYEIKKMAGKLKDIVCLLIGCTREQLEDRTFKETELGEEWWYWKLKLDGGYGTNLYPYSEGYPKNVEGAVLIKPNPRLLLQLIETECGRNIIHPSVWSNSLFADYIPIASKTDNEIFKEHLLTGKSSVHIAYPNWIITDIRFPNELKAIQDRNGISIRVNRFKTLSEKFTSEDGLQSAQMIELDYSKEHPSETALDNHFFDYVIKNNGSLLDLIKEVKQILMAEKII